MDVGEVLAAFDRERRELDVRGFRRLVGPQLVRHVPIAPASMDGGPGQSGFVSFSRHSPTEVEAAIDEVIASWAELHGEQEWKVFEHDLPVDLTTRLASRGFRVGEREELLILPVADAGTLLGSPSAHRVGRVTESASIADYLAVAATVWSEERGHAAWLQDELRDNASETALYVAYVGDTPAASARSSFPRGSRFAGLWAGATLPAHRRLGLYRALVQARAREAAERGFDYLMVDALGTSQPTLKRLGFRRVSASYPCRWSTDSVAERSPV